MAFALTRIENTSGRSLSSLLIPISSQRCPSWLNTAAIPAIMSSCQMRPAAGPSASTYAVKCSVTVCGPSSGAPIPRHAPIPPADLTDDLRGAPGQVPQNGGQCRWFLYRKSGMAAVGGWQNKRLIGNVGAIGTQKAKPSAPPFYPTIPII